MRYAIVGCGSRHQMYRDALCGPYADRHSLVALCDSNQTRLSLSSSQARTEVACYAASDFSRMIQETRPDTIIVATPDFRHADTIVAAFEAGCDVICEKPLTIDLPSLARILDTRDRTGRSLTVTFNYRYSPARTHLKEVLASGAIGTVTAVDFTWHLDRIHGADYFRRWHRDKAHSGGLFVHKATHHFDLLNWWLDAMPETVHAQGERRFYTPDTARALGLTPRGDRCSGCPARDRCDFALDLSEDDNLRSLYQEAEADDGYIRDACPFDADIGIEDTLQAQIAFSSGAMVNYTLTAYAPWEGFEVRFHGTKGQLWHRHTEVHGIFGGTRPAGEEETLETTLHIAGQRPEALTVPRGQGAHGGADPVMLRQLFAPEMCPPDPFHRLADQTAGAWSILTGIAANHCLTTGATISIDAMLAEAGLTGLMARR